MESNQTVLISKTLRSIFFILFAGQTVFAILAYVLSSSGTVPASMQEGNMIPIIGCALAAAIVGTGKMLHASRLRAIADEPNPGNKIHAYYTITIILLAMIEAANIILILLYLLTAKSILLLLVAAVLAFAAMQYPGKERVEKELGISLD